MIGDPSSLCSDKLEPTLRSSLSICSMNTFFPSWLFCFVLFCCSFVLFGFWGAVVVGLFCWVFLFVFLPDSLLRISVHSSHSSHPRRAQCAPGVSKQQPEGNTWPAKGSWEAHWQSEAIPPHGWLLTVLANGHAMAQANPTMPVKPSTCSSGCLPLSSITTQAPSKGLCSAHSYIPRETLKTTGRLLNSEVFFWKPT